MELKSAHDEKKRIYLECKNVEKSLQRNVQEAKEEKQIEPLIDKHTKIIADNVPTKITCLLQDYRKVRSEEVTQK